MKNFLKWFIIILLYTDVFGQTKKIDTLRSVKFQDVEVSSTRFETQKNKIPNYIQRVERQEILFENPGNTADLLQNNGRAYVQRSQSGGGSPIIRGFEANRILIVVDGVRMNNAIFRGGHLQNILRVQPEMLQNIEVFSGAGSLLYGSDALGGVMSFNTLKPKFNSDSSKKFNVDLLSRYAFATKENTFVANLNYGYRNFASLTSIQIANYGDIRQGENKEYLKSEYLNVWDDIGVRNRMNNRDTLLTSLDKNTLNGTAYSQYNLMQKVSFKQKQVLHHVNLYFTTSTRINRYDRLSEIGKNRLPNFAQWYYGPETWFMANYQLSHFGKTKIYDQLKSTIAYQYFNESRNTRRWQSDNLSKRNENLNLFTINSDAKKSFGNSILQYGLELNLNQVESKANQTNIIDNSQTNLDTRYPDGGSTMNNYNVYANIETPMNDKVNLIGGLRYNYNTLDARFNSKTFFPFEFNTIAQRNQAISGQLSFLIKPIDGWKIAITYSRGFRSPNVDDVAKVFESTSGTSARPGLLIIPNPNLKPEITNTMECLIDYDLDHVFGVELNPYFTFINNWINLQRTRLNGNDTIDYDNGKSLIVQSANVNNGNVAGFNANLYYRLGKHVTIRGGAVYTNGRITLDSISGPLDHIPPFYAFFNASYQKEKFNLQLSLLYNDIKASNDYRLGAEDNEQYSANPIKGFMPAWAVVNLKWDYKITKELTIQSGIDNIMDVRYRTFGSGVSGVGRNVFFALRGNF